MRAATAPAGFVLLLACLVAGPQSAVSRPRKPEPAPIVVPDPPPPVVLSARVISEASAYHSYMMRTSSISPAFVDGPSVARALRTGVSYEPEQLLRGAVAYGAVVAMQDQTFMASLRTYAVDAGQRHAVAAALRADPTYAAVFRGSDTAAGLVINALGGEGYRLFAAGKAVKQSAYDVQHADWSKDDVEGRPGRLADAKALSMTPGQPEDYESARLTQAANAGGRLDVPASSVPPPYTPMVLRSLAIAALAALGEAGDENAELVLPLLSDPYPGNCLSMAKLNLYQCLAVSKPHYEDIFCLGQHVMMDTGQCMIKASGAPLPAELMPRPMDPTPRRSTATPYRPSPAPARPRGAGRTSSNIPVAGSDGGR